LNDLVGNIPSTVALWNSNESKPFGWSASSSLSRCTCGMRDPQPGTVMQEADSFVHYVVGAMDGAAPA
jgi:hypothetical protein